MFILFCGGGGGVPAVFKNRLNTTVAGRTGNANRLRDVKCNNPRLKSFYTSRRRQGRRVIRLPGTTSFTTRYRSELSLNGFPENIVDPLPTSITSNGAHGRRTEIRSVGVDIVIQFYRIANS